MKAKEKTTFAVYVRIWGRIMRVAPDMETSGRGKPKRSSKVFLHTCLMRSNTADFERKKGMLEYMRP